MLVQFKDRENNTNITPKEVGNLSNLNTTAKQNLVSSINEVNINKDIKIVTGQECPTNRYVDGKQVFVKRIDCGALPNNSTKYVETGIPEDYIIEIPIAGKGMKSDKTTAPLPYITTGGFTRLSTWIQNNQYTLQIITTNDMSTYNAIVDLYYTKN